MAKDSMVIFRATADALSELDGEEYKAVMQAILSYGFDGKLPEFTNPVCRMAWKFAKPQIDACTRKYDASVENGKKGGRPRKPNQNPTETQSKPKNNLTQTLNEKCEMRNDKWEMGNDKLIASSSSHVRVRDEDNPDDDYDLRHEDDGIKHFSERVALGLIRKGG